MSLSLMFFPFFPLLCFPSVWSVFSHTPAGVYTFLLGKGGHIYPFHGWYHCLLPLFLTPFNPLDWLLLSQASQTSTVSLITVPPLVFRRVQVEAGALSFFYWVFFAHESFYVPYRRSICSSCWNLVCITNLVTPKNQ